MENNRRNSVFTRNTQTEIRLKHNKKLMRLSNIIPFEFLFIPLYFHGIPGHVPLKYIIFPRDILKYDIVTVKKSENKLFTVESTGNAKGIV